ncbi:MAG TPA: MurR/RpiR family transcriptional regulator, partial [Candidatus Sulfomarinibacteraceae bacterium]|nr:MurR/RpiR family transcriptional regulator [Candidatus Sulfomarinibacteraceae bacterium]
MPTEQKTSDVRDRILDHVGELPPQQRAIADYLLEHLDTVPFLSVPALARRVGVSEATVVRFGQRIGFTGFAELKTALVELLQERLGVEADERDVEELDEDLLEAVASHEARNIRRTVDSIDREVFAAIADRVFAADQVYTFGMGISAHLAELAAYTLIQIGVSAHPLSTGYSSPREQLVTLRRTDLLLVVSLPPYSRQSLEMVADAANAGVATVAFCDRLTAPAARRADLALAVRSDNLTFTNAVAAMTVVINALATTIATRHRDEAIEAFTRIGRVLADDPDVMPEGS